eukprot:3615322-Pleurochrysis_carterae.AAC.1
MHTGVEVRSRRILLPSPSAPLLSASPPRSITHSPTTPGFTFPSLTMRQRLPAGRVRGHARVRASARECARV